jgi:hypothetical protein
VEASNVVADFDAEAFVVVDSAALAVLVVPAVLAVPIVGAVGEAGNHQKKKKLIFLKRNSSCRFRRGSFL